MSATPCLRFDPWSGVGCRACGGSRAEHEGRAPAAAPPPPCYLPGCDQPRFGGLSVCGRHSKLTSGDGPPPAPSRLPTPEEMALRYLPRGPRRSREKDAQRAAFAAGVRAALKSPKAIDPAACPDCREGIFDTEETCDGCDRAIQVTCPTCSGTGRRP